MMFDVNTQDYGDIAPLVKAIGGLSSAGWALFWGFRGRNRDWEPPDQPLSALLSRVAAVAAALGLAYAWYELTDPKGAAYLVRLLWPSFGATVLALLFYGFLLKVLVHNRKFSIEQDVMLSQKVLGGIWMRRGAREAQRRSKTHLTTDELLWTMENKPDLVWSSTSQGLAQVVLNVSYVILILLGAGALTCGGATIIAAQAPRVQEFTITPSQVRSGESSLVTWRVVNSKSVNLDPVGNVPPLGSRVVRPDKDIAYTLVATNQFATTGVQQSIEVTLVGTPPKLARRRLPSNITSPSAGGVTIEARECELTENVVVRGEGWLQNDHLGTATANCRVKLPRSGKWEVFVAYASPDSRPVRIALNSKIVAENGLAAGTGGAGGLNELDQSLGRQDGQQGENIVQFHSEHPFPYIRRIRFLPAS